MTTTVDALVVATHPDDAEATCGGTIAKLVGRGLRVGVLDLSRGEMGSRGSMDERDRECREATALLGLCYRENLGQPDSKVESTVETREAIARVFRTLRPRFVLAPWWKSDLHPDHAAVGKMAREAFFLSGLKRLFPEVPAYRPRRIYYYPSHDPFEPSFIVTLDEAQMAAKIASIRCYASQVNPSGRDDRGQHFVHGMDLVERITLRNRYFGSLVTAPYGEPFRAEGFLTDTDPLL
jgi:bacillithiol biosynthesis deacetylase BshB1